MRGDMAFIVLVPVIPVKPGHVNTLDRRFALRRGSGNALPKDSRAGTAMPGMLTATTEKARFFDFHWRDGRRNELAPLVHFGVTLKEPLGHDYGETGVMIKEEKALRLPYIFQRAPRERPGRAWAQAAEFIGSKRAGNRLMKKALGGKLLSGISIGQHPVNVIPESREQEDGHSVCELHITRARDEQCPDSQN